MGLQWLFDVCSQQGLVKLYHLLCWQVIIIVKMCESWLDLDFSLTELLICVSKIISTQVYYLSMSPRNTVHKVTR